MKKILIGIAFLILSGTANAISVTLLQYNQSTGSGAIFTLITDGSHVSGIAAPTTAAFDWDGTTLSSTGLFTATQSFGSSPISNTIMSEQYIDLSIDTSTNTASATAYICVEGTHGLDASLCGGYSFGDNFSDESTTVWGPGTAVTQTLGGDDVPRGTEGVRTISWTDQFSVFTLISGVDGLTPGDVFSLGNGTAVGLPRGHAMVFQVVPIPAAAWLFGSALGLLGWTSAKRRNHVQ